jgi:ERCC4-related helicase
MDNRNKAGWIYSPEHNENGKIIETQSIWGEEFAHIWLPSSNKVVRVALKNLKPAAEARNFTSDYITYLVNAARVSEALNENVLLAPLWSAVIPLPHQLRTLSKAISKDSIRYLLADEVGLGKTIEAGLIMRELKLRGFVSRTLIVSPKGLVPQWAGEMQSKFHEHFSIVVPGDMQLDPSNPDQENQWQRNDQVICSMDSIKPLERRRGWNKEQVTQYNKSRFGALISAGWDLIIVDEAHRLGGSTDQVARYKLGRGLAEAAPYILLLSATPHQGKTHSFQRILSLLDDKQFPDEESIQKEKVRPYVLRTEKRCAIDVKGKTLFKPRKTQLEAVPWLAKHSQQKFLYEAVTDYVRNGYNQAIQEKQNYIGFLMVLMQRLVTSSTEAIRATLERRVEALDAPEEQLLLFSPEQENGWEDMDGQSQLETILKNRFSALNDEKAQVAFLLDTANICKQQSVDAKAEALLNWIYQLQQEEQEPGLKILIFTEFIPTQEMLRNFLSNRGFTVVCLNGSMDMNARIEAQTKFAREVRIMVSTDAGGEGLNLQFCHIVINYDIPWNPMRLEQRIGRVDRIGQEKEVRALNLVLENSIEHRVLEVLGEKLKIIFAEFGVDKTADVLDSAESEKIFNEMFLDAIVKPDSIDNRVSHAVSEVKYQADYLRSTKNLLSSEESLDTNETNKVLEHPLPHWLENMTKSFISYQGGSFAKRDDDTCTITWPDGNSYEGSFFPSKQVDCSNVKAFTLEDERIRKLVKDLPSSVPGQPVLTAKIPGITEEINGLWSLLKITVFTETWIQSRIMPIFCHNDGRVLLPTARRIWNILLTDKIDITGQMNDDSSHAFQTIMTAGEEHGKPVYQELVSLLKDKLSKDKAKAEYSFHAQRRAIARIGLPEVRDYRFKQLDKEKMAWEKQHSQNSRALPELKPLIILGINGEQCEK